MCCLYILALTFYLCVIFTIPCHSQTVNECKLPNGKYGTCMYFKDCKGAAEAIKTNKPPIICGFDGLNPIICCESVAQVMTSGAKSLQKCNVWYSQKVTKSIVAKTSLVSKPSVVTKPSIVDILNVKSNYSLPPQTEVAGGEDSLEHEFPHMAILGFGDENDIYWACGGSLISEKFVLTAAHCLYSREIGDVKFVRLGDLNIRSDTDVAAPQNFKITRKFKHPDYKPPSQYHDIALLELDNPAQINIFVKPACLQTTKKITDPTWIATGWGALEFLGSSANHLQKVNLKEFDFETCKSFYSNESARRLKYGILDESQICAGEEKKDTCQGDSGGPLQIKKWVYNKSYYVIIGVTSFGKACALTKSPGVYTRVSNYIPWIESIVWPN